MCDIVTGVTICTCFWADLRLFNFFDGASGPAGDGGVPGMQERVVDRADKPDKPNRANNRGGGRRLGADARAERRYMGRLAPSGDVRRGAWEGLGPAGGRWYDSMTSPLRGSGL